MRARDSMDRPKRKNGDRRGQGEYSIITVIHMYKLACIARAIRVLKPGAGAYAMHVFLFAIGNCPATSFSKCARIMKSSQKFPKENNNNNKNPFLNGLVATMAAHELC